MYSHLVRRKALASRKNRKRGTVLVVVDQPASIGALPLAVARDAGCRVVYLPGLTMRRIADLYPGEAKTDARDAHIIADAARAMPHTLRAVKPADETVAEMEMLTGFDDDLATEVTRSWQRSCTWGRRVVRGGSCRPGCSVSVALPPIGGSPKGPRPGCGNVCIIGC